MINLVLQRLYDSLHDQRIELIKLKYFDGGLTVNQETELMWVERAMDAIWQFAHAEEFEAHMHMLRRRFNGS